MKLIDPQFANVENIIFDFGGVITDIDVTITVNAFKKLGLTGFRVEDIHPDNTGIFLQLELGEISDDDFFMAMQRYAAPGTVPPCTADIRDAWNALILNFDLRRFELLDKLRQNYRVYLLSNTNLPHREYFINKFARESSVGRTFESYFDRCFYSDAMNMRKPDPEIYREVLRELNLPSEKTLFVDDNAPNLVGAREVGLHTYHMTKDRSILKMFR